MALPVMCGSQPSPARRSRGVHGRAPEVDPSDPRLDASIVVLARRLHFTLKAMSLDFEEAPTGKNKNTTQSPAEKAPVPRTLEAAKSLLRELRPRIVELLGEEALRVLPDCVDIMKPENGD